MEERKGGGWKRAGCTDRGRRAGSGYNQNLKVINSLDEKIILSKPDNIFEQIS